MINYLSGSIKEISEQSLTVIINGIGYSVNTPKTDQLQVDTNIELHSYMHWNSDNGPTLYGFKTTLDKTIFLMIIDCPKIGPKIALNILNQLSANEFLEIISSQDEKRLSSINGIGEKTAENMITFLKRKVAKLISSGEIKPTEQSGFSHYNTLNDALTSLGYTKQEVSKAIQKLSKENEKLTFDQLMRRALSFLSKGL